MQALTINTELVKKCVKSTFFESIENSNNDDYSDNFILRKFQKEWMEYGTLMYPALVINKMTFHGSLTPQNAFEAICASFNEEPKEC